MRDVLKAELKPESPKIELGLAPRPPTARKGSDTFDAVVGALIAKLEGSRRQTLEGRFTARAAARLVVKAKRPLRPALLAM